MANGAIIFLTNDESIVKKEGIPDLDEENKAIFYKILNTGIESLLPLLSNDDKPLLVQVYTDGCFVEGTFDLERDFTSWTFEFKSEFIQTLNSINIEEIDELANTWINTEDCPYDNIDDLKDLITALHTLSIKSSKEQLRMFFRMEL